MKERTWAHVGLFTVNLIYGVNYVVAKGLMPDVIGPSGFILLRILGAGALFWLLHMFRPERVSLPDLGRLVACAFFGVALNQMMFFHGLMRTTPINASIIMVATPILVLVLASVLLRERITWWKAIGVLLGAVGALSLILLKTPGDRHGATVLGDLFILVNATSYGIYLVIVKPLMKKYKATTVMAWCFLFALFFVLPFGWSEFGAVDRYALTTPLWIALGFVVLLVTFLAYLLNTWALGKVSPTVVGTYIYMQPVLAALSTWVFVRVGPERLGIPGTYTTEMGMAQALCAAAIFAGVYLVGRADRVP